LQEIYGVYNPTTGSLFTNFALRRAMEKEAIVSSLLSLFIAADKYNLNPIKLRAAEAIIDRLPFLSDPLAIVDTASSIFDDNTPALDCGLRAAVVAQLHDRMPAIMRDEDAWGEYVGNGVLVRAVHVWQLEEEKGRMGLVTPPVSPMKKRKAECTE
jgi:histone acetyltransferase HTATIP